MDAEYGRLDQSLDKIKLVCHLVGINIKNNKKDNLKLKLMYLFNFQWLNTDLAGAIVFVLGINGKSFLDITYIAPCITLTLLASIKSLTVVLNGTQLQELLNMLKKMEIRDQYRKNEMKCKVDKIIKEHVGFLHRVIKVLNIIYVVLVTVFAVNPLVLVAYKYFKTNELDLVLPFLIWYPFDAYSIRNWPAVYLHQIWSDALAILSIGTSDYIFYTCCTYIILRFRVLQVEIEDLMTENTNFESFHAKFREIVMWHQELIRCSQIIEEIYSKSILSNFVSSSIMICLTGFDVMFISDKIVVMSFVLFLSTSLLQIFLLCYFGDLLMRSSMGVGDAVYESQWYSKGPCVGKRLLLMMIRSHKPCKITAYGFADVNLTAFMRVLSNAWSYFALLNTIYG